MNLFRKRGSSAAGETARSVERCLTLGHQPKATSTIPVGRGNTWIQETCIRCGQTRQRMTHRWGYSEPTPWA